SCPRRSSAPRAGCDPRWTRRRGSCPAHRRSPGRRCACPNETPTSADAHRPCGAAGSAGECADAAADPCCRSLLLLAFFAADGLTFELHAFALIRLRRTPCPDFGANLADQPLVHAFHLDRGRLFAGDLDAL